MKSEVPIRRIDANKLHYLQPILASDGQIVVVKDNGKIADILAIQFRSLNSDTPDADVVTSFRIAEGIAGLKKFRDEISRAISDFENREP